MSEGQRTKTSLSLDRDLYRRLRVFAAEHDKRVVDVMEAALAQYLDRHQHSGAEKGTK